MPDLNQSQFEEIIRNDLKAIKSDILLDLNPFSFWSILSKIGSSLLMSLLGVMLFLVLALFSDAQLAVFFLKDIFDESRSFWSVFVEYWIFSAGILFVIIIASILHSLSYEINEKNQACLLKTISKKYNLFFNGGYVINQKNIAADLGLKKISSFMKMKENTTFRSYLSFYKGSKVIVLLANLSAEDLKDFEVIKSSKYNEKFEFAYLIKVARDFAKISLYDLYYNEEKVVVKNFKDLEFLDKIYSLLTNQSQKTS